MKAVTRHVLMSHMIQLSKLLFFAVHSHFQEYRRELEFRPGFLLTLIAFSLRLYATGMNVPSAKEPVLWCGSPQVKHLNT